MGICRQMGENESWSDLVAEEAREAAELVIILDLALLPLQNGS